MTFNPSLHKFIHTKSTYDFKQTMNRLIFGIREASLPYLT